MDAGEMEFSVSWVQAPGHCRSISNHQSPRVEGLTGKLMTYHMLLTTYRWVICHSSPSHLRSHPSDERSRQPRERPPTEVSILPKLPLSVPW
ncbi:hypothetical protein CEXT_93421 [Caerostris extrusa]|uniref:Uncharacterized protein n=1 Tax=Caerostris extrusa TaxID=172846 RepID=A0AAV4U249_CAEEX|nr:hypothetical protein CEXT_93421 [Caerostris extrusa]